MNIAKRLHRLEDFLPRARAIEELSDDELAEVITGIPGTNSDELTDDYLIKRSESQK